MQESKAWLGEVSWDAIVSINESKCRDQDVPHQLNQRHAAAQSLWEAHHPKSTTLVDAIDLCRRCNDLRPFVFHCSSTFTSLGKSLVEQWAQQLGSVDAHILCTAIAHYIDGRILKKELVNTLTYLKSKPQPAPAGGKSSSSLVPPIQQRQPA